MPDRDPIVGASIVVPDHPLTATKAVSFGSFEVDFSQQELRKNGIRIHLSGQPLQVLEALLNSRGEIVTREELRNRLWSSATFVDFEHSLNAAVKRLREALGDSADNPRFIETLPRHGYRFIAPVTELAPQGRPPKTSRRKWTVALVAAVTVALVFAVIQSGLRQRSLGRAHSPAISGLAVLPLENISGNPEEEYLADDMTEELITELGRALPLRVISRQTVMHYKHSDKTLPQIARELHVDAIVQGSVLRHNGHIRVTVQLVKAEPEQHLWAESYEHHLRDFEDVTELQVELASEIANQVKLRAQSPSLNGGQK